MATSTSSSTMTPPAIATLSRRRRIQAIWPRERPSIAWPPTLASTASGTASALVGETSIGAVIEATFLLEGASCPASVSQAGPRDTRNWGGQDSRREDPPGGPGSASPETPSWLYCD